MATEAQDHTNRLSSLTCQRIMTLIMQNKPNFQKAKMNVNIYFTKVYDNILLIWSQ